MKCVLMCSRWSPLGTQESKKQSLVGRSAQSLKTTWKVKRSLMRQAEIFKKSTGEDIPGKKSVDTEVGTTIPVQVWITRQVFADHCHSTTCLTRTGREETDPAQRPKSYSSWSLTPPHKLRKFSTEDSVFPWKNYLSKEVIRLGCSNALVCHNQKPKPEPKHLNPRITQAQPITSGPSSPNQATA